MDSEVHSFDISRVKEYLCSASLNNQISNIISVGSGTGYIEAQCDMNIICVDPDPNSWDKSEIKIEPSHASVNDLIESNPTIVGNCVCFLCWPEPNESTYDYDAIISLKPVSIVLIYETIGASGGQKLHKWLKETKDYYVASEDIVTNDVNQTNSMRYWKKSLVLLFRSDVKKSVDCVCSRDVKYVRETDSCICM